MNGYLDNKYVFRFPRTDKYKKKLQNEIALLKYLKNKLNLSIPNYTYITKDKSFAGYLMIEGQQLKKRFFKELPEKTKDLIAKKVANFFSVLHKTPSSVSRKYSVKKVKVQKEYRELITKTNKYILPRVSEKNKILIDNFIKEFKNYLKFPYIVLTHNDLYSSHILLSQNNKSVGIIDFSDRKLDDPARDFAELWDYGEKFTLKVYEYYKGPKDKNFLRRSIFYYKRIPFWEMFSRFDGGRGSFKKGYVMFKERFYNTFNI